MTVDISPTGPPNDGLRSVAFYLPQFHPVAENDAWWGRGFTEWTNVRKGAPFYPGHYQPKVPSALGYYDLREPATRLAQAELAKDYGVDAFCYYHYWFNGRRMLDSPIAAVLESGEPDFSFLLCWANENWTRVWDGGSKEVLIEQRYSEDDDLRHIRHLCEVFEDHRYVRIGGRPVLLVYRAGLLPNPARTADRWRNEAVRLGVAEPWLCYVESFPGEERDPASIGFDAAVEFAPQQSYLPWWRKTGPVVGRLANHHLLPHRCVHRIASYEATMTRMLGKPARPYRWYRCATPGWDNTARRTSGGLILKGNSPELFETWMTQLYRQAIERESPLVFINAWNEWAEGAYLEPDTYWGMGMLEANKRARKAGSQRHREDSS